MIVLLSPHLDDAVLSLWHVLAGPEDVTVVNVFAGIPEPDHGGGDSWWDRLTGAADSALRMRERRGEDREALALAGRTAVDLDLLEGQYRDEAPALEALVDRLGARVPPGAQLLAPAALDGHRSHQAVRAAALVLHERGLPVALYADVPHATRYGWPRWISGASGPSDLEPKAAWQHHMRATGIALDELTPQVHRLDDAAHEHKLEAVLAYRSQVAALEAEFGLFSRPAILRYEVVWPLP